MQTEELLKKAVKVLKSKRGKNIVSIKVEHLTIVAEYFLIASGNSSTQVKALAENLEMALKEQGITPTRMEGLREGRWVAMDYGSLIVHIFHAETRESYMLEKLWDDGENVISY